MNHYASLNELHRASGFPPSEHPLLSIMTCQQYKHCSLDHSKFTSDCYLIAFKKFDAGEFLYGRTKYDHANGSMIYVKPRQIVEISDLELTEKGFLIFIHEDYLLNTKLHSEIKKYGFFDYEVAESLHLSTKEEGIMWELYAKIEAEYNSNQDEFSKAIILTHIDSILNYSERFYKRQFLNRTQFSGTLISKFSTVLNHYFAQGRLNQDGLPTVAYMASQLALSPRYLSDLLKQETGKTALEHIHIALIDEAKDLLLSTDQSIAETAYRLGFENPPYFSRLFKKEVGLSPGEFKEQHLSRN